MEPPRLNEGGTTSLVAVISVIFCVSGAGLGIAANRHSAKRREFIRHSAVVIGVVTALRDERDGTNIQRVYYPRVHFRTDSGRDITFESGMARGGTGWHIGQTVPVRYLLDRPEVAELDSFAALWGPTLLFALLAVVFEGVGVSLWFGGLTGGNGG